MWEGIVGLFAELIVGLLDWEKSPTRVRVEECLRCGYPHDRVQCPKCRYVFRIKPERRELNARKEQGNGGKI